MPSHKLIAERREFLKMTKRELSRRLREIDKRFAGLSPSDLSKIERGKRRVFADDLPGFAEALGCDVADLVDKKGT